MFDYKYAEIEEKYKSHLSSKKTNVFGGIDYILYDGDVILALDGSVANNAHTIAYWLNNDDKYTNRLLGIAQEMYSQE